MKSFLLISGVLLLLNPAQGLLCYVCSANEFDERCANDPESIAIKLNCNKNYCTSFRQEFLDPKGKLNSMIRTCEDEPAYMNEVFEDTWYRYYTTACQADLCNGGDGKDTAGSGLPGKMKGYGVLYVPGISSGSMFFLSRFVALLSVFLIGGQLIL